MQNGIDPRTLLLELGVEMINIPQYVDDVTLWKLILNMLAEPPRRHKLRHVNTLDDVVRLLKGKNHHLFTCNYSPLHHLCLQVLKILLF